MNRVEIVNLLLREMAEEMPVLLRALPDGGLWQAMASGLIVDAEPEALAAIIAEDDALFAGAPDWQKVYGEMRAMVNEWPAGGLSSAAG